MGKVYFESIKEKYFVLKGGEGVREEDIQEIVV